ncbi:MAG: hypothetical protein ACOYJA_06225 [Christensenellales bacterium]|jgi:hypothetical protein
MRGPHSEISAIFVKKKIYAILTVIILLTCFAFWALGAIVTAMSESRQQQRGVAFEQQLKQQQQAKQIALELPRERVLLVGQLDDQLTRAVDLAKLDPVPAASLLTLPEGSEPVLIIVQATLLEQPGQLEAFKELCQQPRQILLWHAERLSFTDPELRDLLGVAQAQPAATRRSLKVLDGFWSGERWEEPEYVCQAAELTLTGGQQRYILQYQDANREDLEPLQANPLLYRQMVQSASVYVANGSYVDDIPQGVLRGVLMQRQRTYLFPVMNIAYFAVQDCPLLSDENAEQLEALYARTVRQLCEDILVPDLLSVCDKLGQRPTFFAAAQIAGGEEPSAETLDYYQDELNKHGGALGVVWTKQTARLWTEWIDQMEVLREPLQALITDGTAYDGLSHIHGQVGLLDFSANALPISQISQEAVRFHAAYQPLNQTPANRLNYLASVYGYGISSVGVQMEAAYYPGQDKWNHQSRTLSKELGKVVSQIRMFEAVTVGDAARKVAAYELMEPVITYPDSDRIRVEIAYFSGSASFLLSTDHQVGQVIHGQATRLDDQLYLITVDDDTAEILLEPSTLTYQP